MARAKTLKEVETKYSKKIGKLLDKMKDSAWEDFLKEIDKLRDKMQKEMNEIGIK